MVDSVTLATLSGNMALLEIGTEELPPGFLSGLPNVLSQLAQQLCADARLSLDEATVWTTPRRIALILTGLPDAQPDDDVVHKGPPLRIAFNEKGEPNKPAEAFAKKLGLAVSDLKQEDLGGETYLVHHEQLKGKPTPEVLAEIFPAIIDKLQGPRFMRWGHYDIRFPRPIHWLVALWNSTPVPVTVGHLTASAQTRGHRLYAPQPIALPSVQAYAQTLEAQGHVVVEPQRRRTMVLEALGQKATEQQGTLIENDELLDEVVNITEWPWVFCGGFETEFLALPKAVITTVMASHQRYFALENAKGDLLPVFLGVSNGEPQAEANIVAGNQKVLRARLNDAGFFLDTDMKTPLTQRQDALAGITFQKGLGTMAEKSQRVEVLSHWLANTLSIGADEKSVVDEAAPLVKADLTTHMVFEFTELEGHIGEEYARRQGHSAAVATAIVEHYQPRFQGDNLPATAAGTVLSLADKLDTLVCVLSQPNVKMPTGSSDPLGLRRLVNGVLLMLMAQTSVISLQHACAQAYQQVPLTDKLAWDELWNERIVPFAVQRLRSLWQEQGVSHDVAEAMLAEGIPVLPHVLDRLATLHAHQSVVQMVASSPSHYAAVVAPANRIQKILGKHLQTGGAALLESIDTSRFENDAEKALYAAVSGIWSTSAVESNPTLWQAPSSDWLDALAPLAPKVDAFFESVMVNADDATVKANRHALLSSAMGLYHRLGDVALVQEPDAGLSSSSSVASAKQPVASATPA